MTREYAIRKFREQWNWMADKSEKLKRKVTKFEYFDIHDFDIYEIPMNGCFLCQYADEEHSIQGGDNMCEYCPIDFWAAQCTSVEGTDYDRWYCCPKEDWKEAARLCREIANLPEKEVVTT